MILASLIECCFFFKQKTAYELRISDWSSDVCSSDLVEGCPRALQCLQRRLETATGGDVEGGEQQGAGERRIRRQAEQRGCGRSRAGCPGRSEEHTSELQSLMRISYAVFCLKKKKV